MGQRLVGVERVLAMDAQTNLRVLRKSRKKPERGDFFAMQIPDESYLFGRVILAGMPQGRAPMPGANLIYIYTHRSPSRKFDERELLPGKLLIPPVWTNDLGWAKGYFETLENRPLREFDVLRQHCFRRAAVRPGAPAMFLDEHGEELKRDSEHCGEWGLVSYRWIDDRVSDAIGIARAPEG